MVKTMSFPGLGIENFTLDPIAFTIPVFGGISVRWYGIIITLGIVLAFAYCAYRSKQEGIIFDDLLDIAIFTIIFGVIGARAYYVLTSLDHFDSFYEVIAIWEGGMAIYGSVIAGALTIWLVCKKKKIKTLKMMDATAPGVMIGQILGRWGNFCNGEAHGGVVSEGSPLYFLRMGLYPNNIKGVTGMAYVHPAFLYESLWNLIGFLLIHFLYKKKKFDGQIVLMYLTWYGFGRMFIEGLRTDSLMVGVFRISQVVGFLCFAAGSTLLIIFSIRARRKASTDDSYTPAYSRITGIGLPVCDEEEAQEAEDLEEESAPEEDEGTESPSAYTSEQKEELKKRLSALFEGEEDQGEE